MQERLSYRSMIKDGDLVFFHFFDIGGEVDLRGLIQLKTKLEEYGKVWVEKLPGASWIEDGVRIAIKDHVSVAGQNSYTEVKIFPIGGILCKVTVPFKDTDFRQVFDLVSKAEGQVYAGESNGTLNDYAKVIASNIRDQIRPFIINPYTNVDYSEKYYFVLIREGENDLILKK